MIRARKLIYGKQNRFYSIENRFLTPVLNYVFNINVVEFTTVPEIENYWDTTEYDPCARIYGAGENTTNFNFVRQVTSYTEMYESTAHSYAEVNTFVWSACQDAIIEYNGPGQLTAIDGQSPDPLYPQTRHLLTYNIPNTYDIEIKVIPKAIPCNVIEPFSGGGQAFPGATTPPAIVKYFNIGSDTGTVRVVGDANAAPDRFLFEIDNQIVLDTFYRGASTETYWNEITSLHALPGASGLPLAPIVECSACGSLTDNDPKGRFELIFEKTTSNPFLTVSAIMPIKQSANTWTLEINCPEIVIEPLFGFDLKDKTFQGENLPPVTDPSLITKVYNEFIQVTPLITENSVTNANAANRPFAWSTRNWHTYSTWEAAIANAKIFYFNVSTNTDGKKIVINKCNHFFISRTGSGPSNLALVRKWSTNTELIADIDISSILDGEIYATANIGEVITSYLSASPIEIDNEFVHTFYIVPYNAEFAVGRLRFFDEYKVFKDGVDISFDGYVIDAERVTRQPSTAGIPSYTITAQPDPNAPSAIYVSGAGVDLVSGTYLYALDYYANEYSYYNATNNIYISQSTKNYKWGIFEPDLEKEYYISTLSADYPVGLEYETLTHGVTPGPIVYT